MFQNLRDPRGHLGRAWLLLKVIRGRYLRISGPRSSQAQLLGRCNDHFRCYIMTLISYPILGHNSDPKPWLTKTNQDESEHDNQNQSSMTCSAIKTCHEPSSRHLEAPLGPPWGPPGAPDWAAPVPAPRPAPAARAGGRWDSSRPGATWRTWAGWMAGWLKSSKMVMFNGNIDNKPLGLGVPNLRQTNIYYHFYKYYYFCYVYMYIYI
jgi:hypothetical protein